MVFKIVNYYKNAINEYCNIDNMSLEYYLFEKTKPSNKNGEIKDGFHIIFPNITLYYKIRHLIIEDVIKNVAEDSMFNKYTNADIIDRAVVSQKLLVNVWML